MASSSESGELITVIQLIRHGSRNPLKVFKNMLVTNPWDNPEELGELTKEGKQEIYNLGRATREKYATILGPKYSKKHFKLSSSGSDRTLMSAQLFAAGVYPPTPDDAWSDTINWNPIPVYEVPSNVLGFFPAQHLAPSYRKEISEAEAVRAQKLIETGVIDYINKNVGSDIPAGMTLLSLVILADTCMIAEANNIELTPWVREIYPDPLRKIYQDSYRNIVNTPFKKMMYMGGFFYELVEHMGNKIANGPTGPNLLVYFAHDTNLVTVLETLKIENYKWPDYGGALTFELWKKQGEYVVKLYYTLDASTFEEPVLMKLPGEVTECGFHNFKNILKEFMLSREDFMAKYLK